MSHWQRQKQSLKRKSFMKGVSIIALLVASYLECANAFTTIPSAATSKISAPASIPAILFYGQNDEEIDPLDAELLRDRIDRIRLELLEKQMLQPPNPKLSPIEFVEAVLKGLLNPDDPFPEDGFRMLLNASTKRWHSKILESIGAPEDADVNVVVTALGEAISRPNQYSILVGDDEDYYTSFQSEPVDYLDGTCWVECRLLDRKDDSLLAATGWNLHQRHDGAWLIDSVDWQDFRDAYRPGIGREEWERICG